MTYVSTGNMHGYKIKTGYVEVTIDLGRPTDDDDRYNYDYCDQVMRTHGATFVRLLPRDMLISAATWSCDKMSLGEDNDLWETMLYALGGVFVEEEEEKGEPVFDPNDAPDDLYPLNAGDYADETK